MKRQIGIALIVLLPLLMLVSGRPSWESLESNVLLNTLTLVFVVSGLNVWLGLAVGWWLLWTSSRWKSVVEWLVFLPLIVPVLASLFGMYLVFARIGLVGTWLGVLFALVIATLPYSIRLATNTLTVIGRPLLEQARLYPPVKRVMYVLVPLLARPIQLIVLFTSVIVLSQFVAVQLIGAGLVPTVTTELYQSYAGNNQPLVLSNTWFLIGFPFVLYIGMGILCKGMIHLAKGRLQ